MKPVFADTFFFFAVLNRADPLHQRAVAYSRNTRLLRITTDWVITELADGLSKVGDRERLMDVYRHIQTSPAIRVVPASRLLLEEAQCALRFASRQGLAVDRLRFVCGHARRRHHSGS